MGTIMRNNIQYSGGGISGGTTEIPISVILTQAQYDALSQVEKEDLTKVYYISDAESGGDIQIDDTTTSTNKVWSSQKTSNEINTSTRFLVSEEWPEYQIYVRLAYPISFTSTSGISKIQKCDGYIVADDLDGLLNLLSYSEILGIEPTNHTDGSSAAYSSITGFIQNMYKYKVPPDNTIPCIRTHFVLFSNSTYDVTIDGLTIFTKRRNNSPYTEKSYRFPYTG